MTETEQPRETPKTLTLKTLALKAVLAAAGDDVEDASTCEKQRAALAAIRESFETVPSSKPWNEEALAADVFPVVACCLRSENREVRPRAPPIH